jgi:hypothetical protein
MVFTYLKNELRRALFEFQVVDDRCMELQHLALKEVNRAFVTFETEEGLQRCLADFNKGHLDEVLIAEVKYRGVPLKIRQAGDPSEIIWENFGYPLDRRLLRILATSCIMVSILVVSYILIFEVQFAVRRHPYIMLVLRLIDSVCEHELQASNIKASLLPYGYCDTYSVLISKDQALMSSVGESAITYEKVQWDAHPEAYNRTYYGGIGLVECYCKQVNYEQGGRALYSRLSFIHTEY